MRKTKKKQTIELLVLTQYLDGMNCQCIAVGDRTGGGLMHVKILHQTITSHAFLHCSHESGSLENLKQLGQKHEHSD